MRDALPNLKASLDRVRAVANNAIKSTPRALKSPALRERHNTVLSAVVVSLSGFLESFLREVAEEYSDAICQKSHPFISLKDDIRDTHFHGGGKFLSQFSGKNASNRYSWTTTDRADLARRLASVNAATPYELIWEAFAETGGNPNSAVIREFLRRFGVAKPMATLASHMTHMSEHTLTTTLESFIAIRNECAHTGSARRPPTGPEVRDYCNFLENIATGIVKTLTAHNHRQERF
jgi:hypothetical protein